MSKQVYSVKEATEAFGVSRDVITRAINAGDLETLDPRVHGKPVSVRLVAADELWRWMRNEPRS